MAKVKTTFFCIQTKKKYFRGQEYDGTRTDLAHLLESEEVADPPKEEKKEKLPKRPARRKKTKK